MTICHHTHSQKNPFVTITVSVHALPAHLRHGDTAGPCSQEAPSTPALPAKQKKTHKAHPSKHTGNKSQLHGHGKPAKTKPAGSNHGQSKGQDFATTHGKSQGQGHDPAKTHGKSQGKGDDPAKTHGQGNGHGQGQGSGHGQGQGGQGHGQGQGGTHGSNSGGGKGKGHKP